jgi:hypothetical protein
VGARLKFDEEWGRGSGLDIEEKNGPRAVVNHKVIVGQSKLDVYTARSGTLMNDYTHVNQHR